MKDKKTEFLQYLRLGELHDIVADVVQQSQRVNAQSGILRPPDLVQQLSQLQHTASCVHSDQDVAAAAKGLHDIGCESGKNKTKQNKQIKD